MIWCRVLQLKHVGVCSWFMWPTSRVLWVSSASILLISTVILTVTAIKLPMLWRPSLLVEVEELDLLLRLSHCIVFENRSSRNSQGFFFIRTHELPLKYGLKKSLEVQSRLSYIIWYSLHFSITWLPKSSWLSEDEASFTQKGRHMSMMKNSLSHPVRIGLVLSKTSTPIGLKSLKYLTKMVFNLIYVT